MAKRQIIKIDAQNCNGCGQCIPNCPEGAIQIIDGKARLVSDLFCDGLGACIGHCPQGAITIEEREAQAYDERKVMENIVKQGKNVIRAHLERLKEHGQTAYFQQALDYLKRKGIKIHLEGFGHIGRKRSGCPGAKVLDFRGEQGRLTKNGTLSGHKSQLGQWPIQLMLVPAFAPFLNNADLLIAADCVPFAYADFHEDLLKGKVLLVGCPKFDDLKLYAEKIVQIMKNNNIKSITYAHMEVPCCFGSISIIKDAILEAGKDIPFKEVIIGIKGEKLK